MKTQTFQRDLFGSFRKLVFAISVLLCCSVGYMAQAHAQSDFKALGPDKGQGRDDALFFPNDFEANVASKPDQNGKVLFSLCRRPPFTNSNLYTPFPANNTDAIVADTQLVMPDGTKCFYPQNEQNIVVNPTNDLNVVTSANDYRYGLRAFVYTSKDGGHTFSDIQLPGWDPSTGAVGLFKQVQAGGDPVLTFAPDGTLYYSALVYNFSVSNQTPSGVAVAVSRDGGSTWTAPVMVHYESSNNFFNDKQWIAAGQNGTVYVTWTLFKSNHPKGYLSSNIVISTSHDHGLTWSSPAPVSDAAHTVDQGSSTAVAPNGTLYVAYLSRQANDATKHQIVLARSTDGGRTFTNKELARVYNDNANCYPLNLAQGRFTLSFEQFRLNNFPSLAIDQTSGQLAIVWADDQGNAGCGGSNSTFTGVTNNQVKIITSAEGTHWSQPKTITHGADKVFPAVAMNAGKTVVGFYTRNFAPAPAMNAPLCGVGFLETTDPTYPNSPAIYDNTHSVCLDYAISTSNDGGGTFSGETRVSNQSFNPYVMFSGSFIGDYTGVAIDSRGRVYSAWTDSRGLPGTTTPNQDTVVGKGF